MTTRSLFAGALLFAPALACADAPDPIPTHTFTVAEATKGLKGTGTLMAKIDVEQGGKALGSFTCELFEKDAPKTVANFVGLARGTRPFLDPKTKTWEKRAFFDGLTFHRVIPEFMIQGGDILGTGTGEPGYHFEDEIVDTLKLDKPGVLAMANRGKGTGTNGSQFFITEKAAEWLNGGYNIFGQCEPAALVKTITGLPRGARDVPQTAVVMKKVTIMRGAAAKKAK